MTPINRQGSWLLLSLLFLLTPLGAKAQHSAQSKPVHTEKCIALQIVCLSKTKKAKEDFFRGFFAEHYSGKIMLVGQSVMSGKVRLYALDENYSHDIRHIQHGDTLQLDYPTKEIAPEAKGATALSNLSLKHRMEALEGKYIDVDFEDVLERLGGDPVLDHDGLITKWMVAQERFLRYTSTDDEGYKTFEAEDSASLLVSPRLIYQLYNLYVSGHNDSIRKQRSVQQPK